MTDLSPIHVIGGGLAGSEAAWQIASAGVPVVLHEMRGVPGVKTDAHHTDGLAELVCSNSFRSDDWEHNAVGLLHQEMRELGSVIMASAGDHMVPAGGALLVNLGDLLARWTNDRWISTLHRVLPPTDGSGRLVRRRSAAFFHDGNADAVISCLPGCADENTPARYESVTVSDHLTAKLTGSRGLVANPGAQREGARLLSART